MPSFTSQVPDLQQIGPVVEMSLTVGTVLEDVLKKGGETMPSPVQALAMIDTGATGTVVREEIVKKLALNPVGTCQINTPSSENIECFEYLLRLLFPNNVVIEAVAIAAPLKGQHIQCLIGRDVLQHGVFIYTGYTNSFTLSF